MNCRQPQGLARTFALGLLALGLSGCFGPIRQAYDELPPLLPDFGGTEQVDPVRLVIFPAAHDGPDGTVPCDLCPADLEVVSGTTKEQATLVTAFFYEQIARHPRFSVLDHFESERLAAGGMRSALAEVAARDLADAAIVVSVLEFRERVGNGRNPETPAGLKLFASLVPAAGGEAIWTGRVDDGEESTGRFRTTMRRLIEGGERRWVSGGEFAGEAITELVDDLVDEID